MDEKLLSYRIKKRIECFLKGTLPGHFCCGCKSQISYTLHTLNEIYLFVGTIML